MEVISGIIISFRKVDSGCWYTIVSGNNKKKFFSKKEQFSLFEFSEVVLVNKNCSYFLSDYQCSYEDAPLKKYPQNIVAASWFSVLAESLHFVDEQDMLFVDHCVNTLSAGEINDEKLQTVESVYLNVSGFGQSDGSEKVFREYFPFRIKIRNSLINQIKRG